LAGPIYFIRGNHEDFDWLAGLSVESAFGTVPVDPFDLFHYVPDGTIRRFGEQRLAFLGGVEERTDAAAIDQTAYQSLLALGPDQIDVLVSHEGPYGSSIGFHGDTHGSPLMSQLIEQTRPPFQVAGHAHVLSGPDRYGQTTYLGLDCIVASPIWQPEARGFQPGCLAALDTTTGTLEPVTAAWLADFATPFDFDHWALSDSESAQKRS
jgi:hypothetical protein